MYWGRSKEISDEKEDGQCNHMKILIIALCTLVLLFEGI